jgi:hypothetical protein
VCEGMIKYTKKTMHCKIQFANECFWHKQKSLYFYKFHVV